MDGLIIKLSVGGIYSYVERPKQVLLSIEGQAPMIFSHDREIGKAIDGATQYIKNLIEKQNGGKNK